MVFKSNSLNSSGNINVIVHILEILSQVKAPQTDVCVLSTLKEQLIDLECLMKCNKFNNN
jgi:hypothetical protein